MFPQRLDAPEAYEIARAMLDGFDRHYRLFRSESGRAKHRFETQDWHGYRNAITTLELPRWAANRNGSSKDSVVYDDAESGYF